MSTETKNLKLIKPDLNDWADIRVINSNMDIIDNAVGNLEYLPLTGGTVTGTTTFEQGIITKDVTAITGQDELNITCNGGELSITKNGAFVNDARVVSLIERTVTSGENLTPAVTGGVNYNYTCTCNKYDSGDLIIEYYLERYTSKYSNYNTYVTLTFPIPFIDRQYSISFGADYNADSTYWLGGSDFGTWRSTSTTSTMFIPPYKDARYVFKGRWK